MSGLSEYGGDFGPFCDARKEAVLVEKFGGATVVAISFPVLKIVGEDCGVEMVGGLVRVAAMVSLEVGSKFEGQCGGRAV